MMFAIVVIVITLLAFGECEISKINGNNSSCGNTYYTTVNIGDQNGHTNDDWKEEVKVMIEEQLQQQMQLFANRLASDVRNVTNQLSLQIKSDIEAELRKQTNELESNSQQRLHILYNELVRLRSAIQDGCQSPTNITHITSCKQLPSGSPSDFYLITNSTGDLNLVYCDMDRRCACSNTSGWMRVAYLNMTDPNEECPDELRLINSPKRTCGRSTTIDGCESVMYPTYGHQYSQVCGRIKAYQYGHPDAFEGSSIDSRYVEGVSLTHGYSPRKHIWTFAAAIDETDRGQSNSQCACTRPDIGFGGVVPSLVGQDYFCETGSRNSSSGSPLQFYADDPLWDGEGCGSPSTCCSFNKPPWFCKQLPQPTTDDIELRICGHDRDCCEDIPLEIVEVYIN